MNTNAEIIKAVQQRLADLGYYNGKIDGDAGPATEKAIVAFKTASALNPRLYIGPVTLHSLFADDAKMAIPAAPAQVVSPTDVADAPHMEYAEMLKGTKEVLGAGSNPTILDWAKRIGVASSYTNDGVAWCGLFVGVVMKHTFPSEALPKNPLGARNWSQYGHEVTPGFGAILVFWRGSKTGWEGHVGFYVGEDDHNYYVLGGNQSNTVNVTKIAKNRLLAARAPKSLTSLKKVSMSTSGKVSTNEA